MLHSNKHQFLVGKYQQATQRSSHVQIQLITASQNKPIKTHNSVDKGNPANPLKVKLYVTVKPE